MSGTNAVTSQYGHIVSAIFEASLLPRTASPLLLPRSPPPGPGRCERAGARGARAAARPALSDRNSSGQGLGARGTGLAGCASGPAAVGSAHATPFARGATGRRRNRNRNGGGGLSSGLSWRDPPPPTPAHAPRAQAAAPWILIPSLHFASSCHLRAWGAAFQLATTYSLILARRAARGRSNCGQGAPFSPSSGRASAPFCFPFPSSCLPHSLSPPTQRRRPRRRPHLHRLRRRRPRARLHPPPRHRLPRRRHRRHHLHRLHRRLPQARREDVLAAARPPGQAPH